MDPDDKKSQTERAARGQAAVRVQLDPVDDSAFGRGQQAAQTVRRAADATAGVNRGARIVTNAPVAFATEALGLLGRQDVRVALMDAYDGFVGNPKGGEKVPVQPEQPVEAAMAQGRAAGPGGAAPATQNELLAAILGSGLTVNEAAAVNGMLPAPRKAVPAKDTVMSQAAQLSEMLYQNQIAQANELAKTDLKGARAVTEKATDAHARRLSGLVGVNPLNIAQAELMNAAGEDQ